MMNFIFRPFSIPGLDVSDFESDLSFDDMERLDGQEIVKISLATTGYYDLLLVDGTELDAISAMHIVMSDL